MWMKSKSKACSKLYSTLLEIKQEQLSTLMENHYKKIEKQETVIHSKDPQSINKPRSSLCETS